MIIHLVTFSDESMSRSRELCIRSGLRNGIDFQDFYTPENIQRGWPDIIEQHAQVFRQPEDPRRAWAWWAWKSFIIERSMCIRNDGDILIYSDAGVEFINPVSHITDRMDQDIFLFGNNWEHAHWCKRDVIDEVWPDPPISHSPEERRTALAGLQLRAESGDRGAMLTLEVLDRILTGDSSIAHDVQWLKYGKQVQASVIFFRVSDYTRAFVKEWLDWCLFEGGRLIDDSPSRLPNHPEFQEHRHDQAILTTMAYRDGLRLHWWPAVYNDGQFTYEKLPEYAADTYDPIFHHHRKRNHEWIDAREAAYHRHVLR